MPRIIWKGEKKGVAQGIPKILFQKGATKYPQILMFWRWCRQRRWEDFLRLCGKFIPWKRARPVVASSCILSTRRSVNIVVSDPGITGTRLQRPDKNGVSQLLVSRSGYVVASQVRTIKNRCFRIYAIDSSNCFFTNEYCVVFYNNVSQEGTHSSKLHFLTGWDPGGWG